MPVNWLSLVTPSSILDSTNAYRIATALGRRQIRLILDTTNLGFYSRFLTVSIAYRKRTLPLVWSVHQGKKGWAGVKEQVALLRSLAELIPKGSEVW